MPRRPTTRYNHLIDDSRLEPDAGQLEVLARLDTLALELDGYDLPAASNGLARLFKRKSSRKAPRKAVENEFV